MGIHLSGKIEVSFLPNTLDRKMTMIWILFLNLGDFHSTDKVLALNCPSDHHPFIIDKKSTESVLCFSHSAVTFTWALWSGTTNSVLELDRWLHAYPWSWQFFYFHDLLFDLSTLSHPCMVKLEFWLLPNVAQTWKYSCICLCFVPYSDHLVEKIETLFSGMLVT